MGLFDDAVRGYKQFPAPHTDFFKAKEDGRHILRPLERSENSVFEEEIYKAVKTQVDAATDAIANALLTCATNFGCGLIVTHIDEPLHMMESIQNISGYEYRLHSELRFAPDFELPAGQIRHIYKPYNETPTI